MKKISLILSTVLAGATLAGAAFAGWAVTDNANPLGIKVSPGNLGTGSTYNTIVLDWGSTADFTDISGLALGGSQTKTLGVKSTVTAGANNTITGGYLTVSLQDLTTGKAANTEKLIDHLVVQVKDGETVLGTINPDTTNRQYAGNLATTSGSEKTLSFVVSLPLTYGQSTLTAAKYEEMKNDVVYLKVEWDRPSAITDQDLASASNIYFKAANANYDVKVYAWNSTTLTNNSPEGFGTVAMTHIGGGIYSYSLNTEYDRVIFKYGAESQTGDLTVTNDIRQSTAMYDISQTAWVAANISTPDYYVVGTMNNWIAAPAYKMTAGQNGNFTVSLTGVAANAEFKVLDASNNLYYGLTTINTDDTNIVLTAGGSYTITFNAAKNLGTSNNQYISF